MESTEFIKKATKDMDYDKTKVILVCKRTEGNFVLLIYILKWKWLKYSVARSFTSPGNIKS